MRWQSGLVVTADKVLSFATGERSDHWRVSSRDAEVKNTILNEEEWWLPTRDGPNSLLG